MRNFRLIIWLIIITSCESFKSRDKTENISIDSGIKTEFNKSKVDNDSIYIYTRLVFKDKETGQYYELEEPMIYDYWTEKRDSASWYFEKALKIESIPFDQRLIFAQYLYQESNNKDYITEILNNLHSKEDTIVAYGLMDSYNISFKDFKVSKEILIKYCEECSYQ